MSVILLGGRNHDENNEFAYGKRPDDRMKVEDSVYGVSMHCNSLLQCYGQRYLQKDAEEKSKSSASEMSFLTRDFQPP